MPPLSRIHRPQAADVEQDLDEELAQLRGTVDRILASARPVWGRQDHGLLQSLEYATRCASSAQDLTDSREDAQRWTAARALRLVEQGRPVQAMAILDDEPQPSPEAETSISIAQGLLAALEAGAEPVPRTMAEIADGLARVLARGAAPTQTDEARRLLRALAPHVHQ